MEDRETTPRRKEEIPERQRVKSDSMTGNENVASITESTRPVKELNDICVCANIFRRGLFPFTILRSNKNMPRRPNNEYAHADATLCKGDRNRLLVQGESKPPPRRRTTRSARKNGLNEQETLAGAKEQHDIFLEGKREEPASRKNELNEQRP